MARAAIPTVPADRLPSLDGIRAVAIMMVVISHGWPQLAIAAPARIETIVHGWGSLGVELFFGLSGYLITHLLCRELAATGRLHLPAFYLRRTLRILPPLLLFLATLAVLNLANVLHVPWGDLVAGLCFFKNYLLTDNLSDAWYAGHLWSLSLEEQFYLLLPAALVLAGATRARRAVVVLLAVMPVMRIAWYFLLPFTEARSTLGMTIHAAIDHFLWGTLAAMLRHEGKTLWPGSWLRSAPLFWAVTAFFLFVIPLLEQAGGTRFSLVLGLSLRGAAAIFIINWLELNVDSLAGRLVNLAPVRALGVISYGVYLWQQLFLGEYNAWLAGRFPLALALCLGAAVVSYFAVEAPLLRLRRRLRPTTTIPSPTVRAALA